LLNGVSLFPHCFFVYLYTRSISQGKKAHQDFRGTMTMSRQIDEEFPTAHKTGGQPGAVYLHDYSQESKRRRLNHETASFEQSHSPLLPGSTWTLSDDNKLLTAVLKNHFSGPRSSCADDNFARLFFLTKADDIDDNVWEHVAESTLQGEKTAIQCFKRYKSLQDHPSLLRSDSSSFEGRRGLWAPLRPPTDLGYSGHSKSFESNASDAPEHYDVSSENQEVSLVTEESTASRWTRNGDSAARLPVIRRV
jgi:hypothetical protein